MEREREGEREREREIEKKVTLQEINTRKCNNIITEK